MRVKITVNVPVKNADDIRQVIVSAVASVISEYTFWCFTSTGAYVKDYFEEMMPPTIRVLKALSLT